MGVGRDDHFIRQTHADGITPGQQPRAGRRTEIGGGVEVGEPRPLARELVNVRGGDQVPTEGANVAEAEIIANDDDEIRSSAREGVTKPRRKSGECSGSSQLPEEFASPDVHGGAL